MTRAVAAIVAMAALLFGAAAGDARAKHHHRAAHNAIIFVHGYDGSGAQFESQEMRFTSNGYQGRYITVLEYDSSVFTANLYSGQYSAALEDPIFSQLDQLIAHMKAVTHRKRVDLLAHSLGTKLMQDYLNSSPQRAANVAHYVNIDGQTAGSPPGGVRTLALWGSKGPLSPPGRSITGAKNVTIPDSTHVQTATSPVSFRWMYKFFTGKWPKTTQIVRQRGKITLSGRAVNFPQNTGLSGATVQVWPINQSTGQRTSGSPIRSFTLGSSGTWGPIRVQSGHRYEFTLVRPPAPVHHFYYEPFIRSDHLMRLLESDALREAGGPPDPRSVAMVIIRYKELWGDQGSQSDVLTINGQSVCNPTTCPLNKLVNAMFAADFDHDGASNTNFTWPAYEGIQYFVSSVDVFAAAQSPPSGEVTIGIKSRGKGPTRTVTFPNFAATSDVVTVQLNDFDTTHPPNCKSRHGQKGKCRAKK